MTASKKNNNHDEHADGIIEDRKQAPPAYFNILFYGLIIWGIGFSAYYLLSGWSSEGEFEQKMAVHAETYSRTTTTPVAPAAESSSAQTTAPAGVNVAALYAANCAGCHGAQGSGGFATDLTGEYEYGKDLESIITSIANGRGTMMPGFAEGLSSEEIEALAAYLLEL